MTASGEIIDDVQGTWHEQVAVDHAERLEDTEGYTKRQQGDKELHKSCWTNEKKTRPALH